ncbi:MAG: flavodoxin domain-containing protein [Actinomycetota bacterium]|nr:flavodoxin domain-containing protein [Actinomycetota bacterium]
MRMLISVASKHGATAEIGQAMAEALIGHGIEVRVQAPESLDSVEGYDGVILGSAVYAGHWTAEAKDLVERCRSQFGNRAVWLFSSGPIGNPPKPEEEPVDVAPIMEATGALGHVVFAGKLDRKVLSFGERAIVTAFRVPDGDFRDWERIKEWTSSIAEELKTRV